MINKLYWLGVFMIISGSIFSIFLNNINSLKPLFLSSIFFSFFGLLLSATAYFRVQPEDINFTVVYDSDFNPNLTLALDLDSDSDSDSNLTLELDLELDSDMDLSSDSDTESDGNDQLYFTATSTSMTVENLV